MMNVTVRRSELEFAGFVRTSLLADLWRARAEKAAALAAISKEQDQALAMLGKAEQRQASMVSPAVCALDQKWEQCDRALRDIDDKIMRARCSFDDLSIKARVIALRTIEDRLPYWYTARLVNDVLALA